MQQRTYFLDARKKARDPQSPPPFRSIKHELISSGVDEQGRATQWRETTKPAKKTRATALEPHPTGVPYEATPATSPAAAARPAAPTPEQTMEALRSRTRDVVRAGATMQPMPPMTPAQAFGLLPPPEDAELVDDDEDEDDDEEPNLPPMAVPPATSAPAPTAAAAAPNASPPAETTVPPARPRPAPVGGATEPTPVEHRYDAVPPVEALPVVPARRCGHPHCAACANARDSCAVSGKPIIPPPTGAAIEEHARGFLGLTIGTAAVTAGVVKFMTGIPVDVRMPDEAEVQRIAQQLGAVEWRYMPTVADHSEVGALVSAMGSILGSRVQEVGAQVLGYVMERRQQAMDAAQQQIDQQQQQAQQTAETVRQQESPAPQPVTPTDGAAAKKEETYELQAASPGMRPLA